MRSSAGGAALAIGASLLLAGCLASAPGGEQEPSQSSADEPPDAAIVVGPSALSRAPGSLLAAMLRELTVMEVSRQSSTTAGCPKISFRGPLTVGSVSNPLVYVDGNRAGNTCVLTGLNSGQVDRVEVYPTGHTGRSGYANHPQGLILVFMRGV